MRIIARAAACCAVAATLAISAADGATVVVRNLNDNLAGSLRQAIQDAAPGDTIVFQIPDTETFPANGFRGLPLSSGELVVNKDLTIDGGGARIVIFRGGPGVPAAFRIFNITGGNVTIANLTISTGLGHMSTPSGGGGIYNAGNLVLRNCTFTSNGFGSELGGAIRNFGTLDMANCTLTDNDALKGAGIYNEGNIAVRNSTIVSNRGGDTTDGTAFVQAGGTARVRSTIIADNGRPFGPRPDVDGAFISEGYNFIGNGDSSTGFGNSESRDQVGNTAVPARSRVGVLSDYGGPTRTMQPGPGSPVIDQGIASGNSSDQRGFARPTDQPSVVNASGGDGSDIGACEAGLPQTGPTFTVTTLANRGDSVDPQCTTDDCTLFEALAVANANADANAINFALSSRGAIVAPADAFRITNPVTIKGPGARELTLTGETMGRVLVATAPGVVISGVRFEHGVARAPIPRGGAIFNTAQLTLNDCVIRNSFADAGGGIWNEAGGTLNLYGCTLTGNSNPDEGEGGAINNRGTLSAVNCTFSGNNSFRGGAINDSGDLTMINCTFTNNAARLRGGALEVSPGAVAANTIFAGNTAPAAPDIQGTFTSEGHNFIGKSDGSTGFTHGVNDDIVGTIASPRDPLLGPLQNNGGPTNTHALLAGSPAVDAGDDSRAPRVDQRTFSRVAVADIGAYELGGLPTGLANIATRVRVGTGDDVLIGGFIVTGTQPKRLIARAIGPSTGIAAALADPQLEIFNAAGERVGFNNNWREAANRDEIIATTIAPTNELESAVLGSVIPGAYTAVVRGVGGGTGVGVVEVYDLNRATDSRLANIATRGLVQSGDDVMIGGFIVEGGRDQRLLIRAIGPSLPVPGRLADPLLEIYNRDGVLLTSNDNWRSSQEAEIAGTGIPPTNDLEAAIFGGASAGAYTAIVRGVGGATGVALVEVYALD